MTAQLSLLDATIQQQFETFHAANPAVYERLLRMALNVRRLGRERVGIATLYEALRYEALTTTGDHYRLNNSFRSHYARLLMDTHPDLVGIFLTRSLVA